MTVLHTARGDFETIIEGPEHGPVVVLLHGFPELNISWRHQIPALAAALKTLLLDPLLRQRLGAAGRSLVEAEFSTRRVNEDTVRIYTQAGLKGFA